MIYSQKGSRVTHRCGWEHMRIHVHLAHVHAKPSWLASGGMNAEEKHPDTDGFSSQAYVYMHASMHDLRPKVGLIYVL